MRTDHSSGRLFTANDGDALRETVSAVVAETPVTDIHTHLFAPAFGRLLRYGIDELLTYHYLVAEVLGTAAISYDRFWSLDKKSQADLVWQTLYLDRSPISEACRGPLTCLRLLGLDASTRDLESFREYFRDVSIEDHVEKVFECARLKSVVMTNNPFDESEREVWQSSYRVGGRFRAALRIDPLFLNWQSTCGKLKAWGYDTDALLSKKALEEVRRFLDDWLYRTKALYMAVSLPPAFTYPQESGAIMLLEQCVLPVAQNRNVPFAMMMGVRRGVNPAIRLAGDGIGRCDIKSVERLCAKFPDNKFMVTMLSRENQHELCVAARKFRNLFVFGCWWFINTPSLVEEVTRMRLELLGLRFIAQHSDARVLEQVLYKWEHARAVVARTLTDKYSDLVGAGWSVSEGEIRRDAARLLDGSFWEFLK